MDVPKAGADILEEVEESLDLREREAAAVEVPRDWIQHIGSLFRHFA